MNTPGNTKADADKALVEDAAKVRAPLNAFLTFFNSEILRAHGQLGRSNYIEVATKLAKLAFALTDGYVIIQPKYLWESVSPVGVQRLLDPLVKFGLLAFASPSSDFSGDLPKKRRHYRDAPALFPLYFADSATETLVGQLAQMPYVRRSGGSATGAISQKWRASLDNDRSELVTALGSAARSNSLDPLRYLDAAYEIEGRLDGRAFVRPVLTQVLGIQLDGHTSGAIDDLVNSTYLAHLLSGTDSFCLVDTPLGPLDFGLRRDPRHYVYLVSWRVATELLRSSGLSSILTMPWRILIELRLSDPSFATVMRAFRDASRLSISTQQASIVLGILRQLDLPPGQQHWSSAFLDPLRDRLRMLADSPMVEVSHVSPVSPKEVADPRLERDLGTPKTLFVCSAALNRLEDVVSTPSASYAVGSKTARSVFVVHGRDLSARDGMFAYLRSLGLRPIEWSQAVALTQSASPYVGEVLDEAFRIAQAVVVLFTPDETASLRVDLTNANDQEQQPMPQPRPNVLFEAGMALGVQPKRTVLVEFGSIRAISDLTGRHVLRATNAVDFRNELAQRLINAGCDVDRSGRDWLTAGNLDPVAPS